MAPEIVIVEVKTTLKTQDVKAFVQKLKQVRVWLDEYKTIRCMAQLLS
ncbi:MAG: hypothetical protein IPJ13_28705 [Saprospiraceae bacterium]|nr:hypothetical protein [Saprospiraceae bacterium]